MVNRPKPLQNYNSLNSDVTFIQNVRAHGADWALPDLTHFGQLTGSIEVIDWGFGANELYVTADFFQQIGNISIVA